MNEVVSKAKLSTKDELNKAFTNLKAAESALNQALEDNIQDSLVLIQAKTVLEATSKVLRQVAVEMRFAQ